MNQLAMVFQRGWVFLKRHWPYGLSLVLLVVALSSVVQAEAAGHDNEDCWRVLSSCEVQVAQQSAIEPGEFDQAQVLALTDYTHYVSYKVVFQGNLDGSTDTNQFITQVSETLADERGWLRAGYVFNRVQLAAQADFTLTLIQAELLDAIPGCDHNWSCRSGSGVYINENRWNGATTAWNHAGGSLRDYRHMVVNHEVGHWLGHGHANCSAGVNNLAPVMQQQSISLQGCKFNPWPLSFEIDALL